MRYSLKVMLLWEHMLFTAFYWILWGCTTFFSHLQSIATLCYKVMLISKARLLFLLRLLQWHIIIFIGIGHIFCDYFLDSRVSWEFKIGFRDSAAVFINSHRQLYGCIFSPQVMNFVISANILVWTDSKDRFLHGRSELADNYLKVYMTYFGEIMACKLQ